MLRQAKVAVEQNESSERPASLIHTAAQRAERICSVAAYAAYAPGIEELASSWQRSAEKYGIDPVDRTAPRILTPRELKDFREPLAKLIFSAQQKIDRLYKVEALFDCRSNFTSP
jgi:transcriptional regulator of acetoin/glycerol metabolism